MTVLTNWEYRQANTKEWKKARPLPATEIHPDLQYNREIPDPFVDDHEKSLQWIGEMDWEYQTTFNVDNISFRKHQLVFEGLDTFADIYLNDIKILSTDNMFIEYKVQINKYITKGRNTLRLYFKSALIIARSLEKKHFKALGFNGESSRMQIRKAQYHYGWDWGPTFMTCGPYKPIRYESYNSFIEDVYVKADVDEELNVSVDFQFVIDSIHTDNELSIEMAAPDDSIIFKSINVKPGNNLKSYKIKNPQLWFPFTHGIPNLYTFTFTLKDSKPGLPQKIMKHVGFRRIELVQETFLEQPGTSFYFKINNIPIYCNGSNWIPAHSFQTELSNKDYTEWLELLVNGNQNMVRVWGGGYYEQDIFYEECDRLGILVWQDMMFACGQYPGYKEFVDLVSEEIKSQLLRLRNHCCLALFAGNNEDYQVAEQFDLQWDKDDLSGDYSRTNFPARTLYENTFPKLVKQYFPGVPYHPGSPWGGKTTADQTIGDLHQWNVWHGNQEKYQDWYKLGGRFVSEFGMEALPCRRTYEQCISDESELYPQSYLVDCHNKADGFERRLALYVIENIKVQGLDLDSWIYATQLMQAECLGYAYRCWRREWRGDGKRYSGGAIVWQINDCWPVASWSIVDFYKRPKLGYYSVKRESQPLGVGMYRIVSDDQKELSIDIWGVNSSLSHVNGTLKVDIYNVTTGELIKSEISRDVVLKSNQTTEFIQGLKIANTQPVVVYTRIIHNDAIIANAADWPQPLKYLKLFDRKLNIKVEDGMVRLNSDKPLKGVEILLNKDYYIEDNGFDIFPGAEKVVKVKGLKASDYVNVNYYQKDTLNR